MGNVEAEDAGGTDTVALSSPPELRPSAATHMVERHKGNRLMVSTQKCQAALDLTEKLPNRQNDTAKPN